MGRKVVLDKKMEARCLDSIKTLKQIIQRALDDPDYVDIEVDLEDVYNALLYLDSINTKLENIRMSDEVMLRGT